MARSKWKTRQKGRVPDTWLRLCGREDLSIPIGRRDSLPLVPEISLLPRRISSALLPSMEEERCGVLGQVSVSTPNVVLRRQRENRARQTTYEQRWLATLLSVVRVGCCVSLAEMRSREEKRFKIHLWKTAGRDDDAKATDAEPRFLLSQGWMMGGLKSR
jgi:hypothetical protein